jgi:hypothetical protein
MMKGGSSLAFSLALLAALLICYIWFSRELSKANALLHSIESKNEQLKNEISSMQEELKRASSLLQNVSALKEGQLKNPTWEELKTFLMLDSTNELKYDKQKFDCTAFSLQLLKNARNAGLRVGFVEIEFEGQPIGHMLNAFQTEKGLVFVDVTGNENGTGKDKVAYLEVGKPYGVLDLDRVKEVVLDCSIDCEEMVSSLRYINYTDMFSYEYFSNYMACKDLYETCGMLYNQAAEEYNRRTGKYSYEQLSKWYESLMTLKEEIISNNFYVMSQSGVVKNINIYW